MSAPRWPVLPTAGCLAMLLVVCGVSSVHSLPCPRAVDGGGVQLAKIVCFITASSEHYDFESLRTGMCSHVVLIDLMGVGKDGCLDLLQTSSRALNRFNRMRRRFRDVGDRAKFIVSIGGVAQKSSHFSKALKTVESRQALTDELVSFNVKHGLDGIDIAWFYPAQFGGVESDRTNLVVFLRDLYLRTKACDISLSLTVGVDPKDIELSYDVPRINEVVDFVNLLTGDYHNPSAPTHISPLYGQGPRDRLNINYSVMSYIEAGLNPRKIVILNSCYAYLYISKIHKENTTCAAKLRTVMRLSFLSARELIIRESFQTSWDDMRHSPYGTVTKGVTKKWITYNDVESIRRKADYVLRFQLGGMGLFSVDEDDYGGRAGCGRYPMLRTIVSVLYPELACEEPESDEDVETIVCPYNGYLADPVLPDYYYVCEQGLDLQECPKQRCPQGEIFDETQNCCGQPFQPVLTNPASYNYNLYPQYNTVGPPQYVQPPHMFNTVGPPQYVPSPHMVNTVGPPQYVQPHGVISTRVQPAVPQMQYLPPVLEPIKLPDPFPPHQDDLHCSPATIQTSVLNPPPAMSFDNFELSDSQVAMASTMASTIYEPLQQPSNMVPHVVITSNSVDESMQNASKIEVQPPKTAQTNSPEVHLITDPPVLITPKVNYNRPSKRSSSSRRKSRSRSHSSRASTEASVALESTTSSSSTTETAPYAAESSTTAVTNSKPSRARKTTTPRTTVTFIEKTSTNPATTITTEACTKTSTTVAPSSTVADSTFSSTTLSPNVTLTDITTAVMSTTAPTTVASSIGVTTTTTTDTTTVTVTLNDAASHLVTPVT